MRNQNRPVDGSMLIGAAFIGFELFGLQTTLEIACALLAIAVLASLGASALGRRRSRNRNVSAAPLPTRSELCEPA